MAVEVALNTPLAESLTDVVQPKLSEMGWSTGGLDDSALGEYIILMLVNGKTQDQIAAELSNDLLNLPPEDTGATVFARWLFEQVELLNSHLNGVPHTQIPQTSESRQSIPSYQENNIQGGESGVGTDTDMGEATENVQNGAVPTGPKSMRNGSRHGSKRMIGQISKAMDRSGDAVLHRVRPQQGTERINMHNRAPPKGPRGDQNRNARMQPNGRPVPAPHGGMQNGGNTAPLMQMTPQQQMQLMAMYEEQARMMSQIFSPNQQQTFMPTMSQLHTSPNLTNGGAPAHQQPGRSLFERVEGQPQRQPGPYHKHRNQGHNKDDNSLTIDPPNGDVSSSMEVESSQNNQAEPSSDTICRFNLQCTKQDCPYAHQSPEAPPGTTIDVNDACPFGAACKNRKCVGRHPSPAQKLGHQTQQDCKFFPKCTNTKCPFRHPTMPMCRNGADCKTENCKFTHVKTVCRFNPCLNPTCPYKHAEGQSRGKYGDKVWVAGGDEKDHVSDRKFVDDEMAEEELIVPDVNKVEEIKTEDRDHGSQRSSIAAEDVIT